MGNITTDTTRMAIEDLGTGYEAWIEAQDIIARIMDDIDIVVTNLKEADSANCQSFLPYLYPFRFRPCFIDTNFLTTSKGSFISIILIISVSSFFFRLPSSGNNPEVN